MSGESPEATAGAPRLHRAAIRFDASLVAVKRLLVPLLALMALLSACAHTRTSSSATEALRPVVEGFHKRVRWRDYASAAHYLAPERREAFEKARRELRDDKDLSVTDFELEEVKIAPDTKTAEVRSRISWVRLPSVTEESEQVVSDFAYRDGRWLLVRQQGGPFDAELSSELELDAEVTPQK